MYGQESFDSDIIPGELVNLNSLILTANTSIWFQDHRNDSSKGKKNKIYEHLKKEIDVRAKRVVTKEDVKNQVFFIDKARNAGEMIKINIGQVDCLKGRPDIIYFG